MAQHNSQKRHGSVFLEQSRNEHWRRRGKPSIHSGLKPCSRCGRQRFAAITLNFEPICGGCAEEADRE